MKFHVLTLFPEMIENAVHTSITGRAAKKGAISLDTVNIRDFSDNKHMRVDDYPYGGGAGMVMQPEPVYRAWKSVVDPCRKEGKKPRCIYLTPQGKVLNQTLVEELAMEEELILLCGHYEGIDERVLEEVVTDYVSIGDYVLTGGELAACVLIDAVSRFVPGVLSNEESSQFESIQDNLLEYPHYTRPEIWQDRKVPEVLLKGDHKKIQSWRMEQSLERTRQRRPDLLEKNRPVTAAVFSPTGGTRRAAEIFTEYLTQNPRYMDLTRRKLRKEKIKFSSRELLIAAAPVYGGQLPVIEEPLFANLQGEKTPCVIIAAYGNRHYDDTLAQMKERLENQGFICIGAAAPIIPHIYSSVLGQGRPDEEDRQILRRFAVEIKKRLEKGQEEGFLSVCLPGNPRPESKQMKPVEKHFDRKLCTNCQACVQKCPVNAISQETLKICEDRCLNCMSCTKVCKAGARGFDCSQVRQYLESNYSSPRKTEVF